MNLYRNSNYFTALSEFKAIKKLKIRLLSKTVLKGSVECFKHCKQLNDIDIEYYELRKNFFANIASFVPKLQSLRIDTKKGLPNSFINPFRSMKCIEKIIYNYYDDRDHTTYEKCWFFGKCLLEVILNYDEINVKPITDNCGLIIFKY